MEPMIYKPSIYKGEGIYNIGGGGGGGDFDESQVIGNVTYKVKKIGNQIWTLQNLLLKNINIPIGVAGVPSTPACWYYGDNQYIDEQYGLLYNGYAVDYINANKATLINGWHIPTQAEWDELFTYVGGRSVAAEKLKSVNNWSFPRGLDTEGFCALPAGRRNDDGSYGGFGDDARFWAADSSSTNIMQGYWPYVQVNTRPKSYGHSIRLVKDP